ncbi:MAG: hypothetical protein NT038_05825 [Euryarchaeota archaeon]|nr:hypothetical protein [Euryarchaeota archaeon]
MHENQRKPQHKIFSQNHFKRFDTTATETIPIRMIISISVVAAIAVMVAIGFQNLQTTASEHELENQCRTLQSSLYTLISGGVARDLDEGEAPGGTTRVQTFTLPNNLIYLAFGVDPNPENNGRLITGLTNNGNVIAYQVSGGGKQVFWLSQDMIPFREGYFHDNRWDVHEDQGLILLTAGTTTLVFELVKRNHNQYILIHATDTVEP